MVQPDDDMDGDGSTSCAAAETGAALGTTAALSGEVVWIRSAARQGRNEWRRGRNEWRRGRPGHRRCCLEEGRQSRGKVWRSLVYGHGALQHGNGERKRD